MEAITKYAINSTLGTADFKPLDRMLIDGKILVSSDSVYANVILSEKETDSTLNIENAVKIKLRGAVKVVAHVWNTNGNGAAWLIVYKNGTEVRRVNGLETSLVEIGLGVSVGDIYTFALYRETRGTAKIDRLDICADVKDGSGLEIVGRSDINA